MSEYDDDDDDPVENIDEESDDKGKERVPKNNRIFYGHLPYRRRGGQLG